MVHTSCRYRVQSFLKPWCSGCYASDKALWDAIVHCTSSFHCFLSRAFPETHWVQRCLDQTMDLTYPDKQWAYNWLSRSRTDGLLKGHSTYFLLCMESKLAGKLLHDLHQKPRNGGGRGGTPMLEGGRNFCPIDPHLWHLLICVGSLFQTRLDPIDPPFLWCEIGLSLPCLVPEIIWAKVGKCLTFFFYNFSYYN